MLPEWIDVVADEAHAIALSILQEKSRGAVLVGAARVDTALRGQIIGATRLTAAIEAAQQLEISN